MRTAWGNVLCVVTLITHADKLSTFAVRRYEVRHEIYYVSAFLTHLPRQGSAHVFQKSRSSLKILGARRMT